MKQRTALTLAALAGLLLVSPPFLTYCVDPLSVAFHGSVLPDKTYYLVTDAGGLASMDVFLDKFSTENSLRLSRAPPQPRGFPQLRELWRPGFSMAISSEFGCRKLDDPDVAFRHTAYVATVYWMSFLSSWSYIRQVERSLEESLRRSASVHILPERLKCPRGYV